jgi:hypothetical protein
MLNHLKHRCVAFGLRQPFACFNGSTVQTMWKRAKAETIGQLQRLNCVLDLIIEEAEDCQL